jgi:peptidoglycan/xylan/chitin deacetylase (PgdA/CDA1 family)
MYKYVRFPGFKQKALTLSYDDGIRQDKRLIAIMQKYGLKGTFNINSGCFAEKYEGIERGRMTKEEALDLYLSSGMEVAMHGYRHFSLASVDTALAIEDILTDRKALENMFSRVINGLAYANGSYTDEIIELLKKIGIEWARVVGQSEKFDLPTDWMKWQGTCHHDNPRLMELAKEFVEQKAHWYYWGRNLQLFYIWGHSYEFDTNDNWEVIEKFAEYIGGREDIWYATNGAIYDYLQAAECLQFSADGTFIKNPSAIDVYIDFLDRQCVVPAGKTIRIENGEVV